MKKFFIVLILIILALMAATPYFADMIFDLPYDITSALYTVSTILSCVLISSAISWGAGTVIGLCFGKLKFYNAVLSVTNSVSFVPAFILSTILFLVLGKDFKSLVMAICIPLFFRAFSVSASVCASFTQNNYKVHKLGLNRGLYFSQYTMPFFISPIFVSFLRIVRSSIISAAFILFSGLWLSPDTLTFYILVSAAIIAVVLLNTLCLIIPQSEGEKTWLKRL